LVIGLGSRADFSAIAEISAWEYRRLNGGAFRVTDDVHYFQMADGPEVL